VQKCPVVTFLFPVLIFNGRRRSTCTEFFVRSFLNFTSNLFFRVCSLLRVVWPASVAAAGRFARKINGRIFPTSSLFISCNLFITVFKVESATGRRKLTFDCVRRRWGEKSTCGCHRSNKLKIEISHWFGRDLGAHGSFYAAARPIPQVNGLIQWARPAASRSAAARPQIVQNQEQRR